MRQLAKPGRVQGGGRGEKDRCEPSVDTGLAVHQLFIEYQLCTEARLGT